MIIETNCAFYCLRLFEQVHQGVGVLIIVLLFVENFIALFLIYWLSKAVCRTHFNTLVCCS